MRAWSNITDELKAHEEAVAQAQHEARLQKAAESAATVAAHLARWLGNKEDFLKV